MKKIIFRAPVQTASGYGVHSRMLLKALDEDGRFDITVMSVPWGATPLVWENTAEMRRITELASKFNPAGPHNFDASVQITIPNEFMMMAPKNICITAGIETDRVAPLWQQKCNEVADVVVVPSMHSARGFTTGIYNGDKGPQQLLLQKPLYILPEWVNTDVFNTDPVSADTKQADLSDMPDFNFVCVGLGMDKADGEDRKNITNTVKWFCEQFRGSQSIGLILKVSMVNYSPLDFKNIRARIAYIKAQTGCGQFPKIKLIHGRLSDLELAALYKHPKAKAFITLTHGEGYGLPIIEAAACGLPVIATNWSGHLDFLRIDGQNKFIPVDYDLAPVPESCVWKDVMEAGTRWANPKEADAKMKMAKVFLSYDKPKAWATELASHIEKTFNKSLGKVWVQDVFDMVNDKPVQLSKNVMAPLPGPISLDDAQHLSNITLVAVSDTNIEQTCSALKKSMEQGWFAKCKLFTSKTGLDAGDNVEVIEIPPLTSVADHDRFYARELWKHIDTTHALTVQWDGYVLNGKAWDNKFLEYDLVGAPWFWDNVVGNMGFCLISQKMLAALSVEDNFPITHPLDKGVCRDYRSKLESLGLKFAPVELASKFSVENLPYEGQFGWHGMNPFYGEK
jgi:glycosyltransferase involved in cell wall biosynthesis